MLASEEEKNSARKKVEGVAILERAGHTDGRCLNKELQEVRSPSDTWGRSLPSRQVLGRALDRCVVRKSREITHRGPTGPFAPWLCTE